MRYNSNGFHFDFHSGITVLGNDFYILEINIVVFLSMPEVPIEAGAKSL